MAPTKPRTPNDNLLRVFRGGSWNFTSATYVRAAYHDDLRPLFRYRLIGFRCALRARASRA